jgi:stress response protein YsnF
VERLPVERMLDEPLAPYYDGDTFVIPVMEEVLVVEKRLRLREEVRLTKVREESQHQETVTLRSEVVTIERLDARPETPAEPMTSRQGTASE